MPLTILDHTQALFFGTGRLGRGGCVGSSWLSYRQGSTVSIVLGSTVSGEGRELVESEVAAANAVVGTRFSMIVEQSDVVRPPMIRGRITVVVLPQA